MKLNGYQHVVSWAEERSAVALANYVPCTPAEAAWIARLGAGQVLSCPGENSSMTSIEGDELRVSDAPSMNLPMDTDREVGKESKEPIGSEEGADGWTSPGDKAERNACIN